VWELLLLTLLDGRTAYVAPRQIVSISDAKDAEDPGRHFTAKVKCVVSMTDGKIFTTVEDCDAIDARLREMAERRIQEMRK
jgi:ketosteroid isomerase-like protein